MRNFKALISYSNDWFHELINRNSFIKIKIFIDKAFLYDEDFCLFEPMTHFDSNKIQVVLSVIECSCSIKLLKSFNLTVISNKCLNFDESSCNFSRMIAQCNHFEADLSYDQTIEDYLNLTEFISFINLIIFPILCIFGILTNGFSIFVLIKQDKKNKLIKKSSIYLKNLMLVNSSVNFIYSIIYLFHISNVCLFENGFFCSSVKRTFIFQVIEKYLVEFTGNSIKTTSYILNVLIAKNRYDLLKGEKHKIQYQSRTKFYFFCMIIFVFVILVNIESIFTIEINDFINSLDSDYMDFPIKNTFKNIFKHSFNFPQLGSLENNERRRELVYFYAYVAKFFINDVVLYVFIVIFDYLLLMKLKQVMSHKLKVSSGQKSKITEKENFETRMNLTVLVNCLVLMVLRSFELLISFLVLYEIIEDDVCSDSPKICANVSQLANLFYLISCCLNLVTYALFNSEFRGHLTGFYSKRKI